MTAFSLLFVSTDSTCHISSGIALIGKEYSYIGGGVNSYHASALWLFAKMPKDADTRKRSKRVRVNPYACEAEAIEPRKSEKLPTKQPTDDVIHIYVAGHWNPSEKQHLNHARWAFVAVQHNTIIAENSGFTEHIVTNGRNEGEVEAVLRAVRWAVREKRSNMLIHYQFDGIANWASEKWWPKSDLALRYIGTVNKRMVAEKRIRFVSIHLSFGDNWLAAVRKKASDVL